MASKKKVTKESNAENEAVEIKLDETTLKTGKYTFDDSEILVIAKETAQLEQDKDGKIESLKAVTSQYKADITKISTDISTNNSYIRQGYKISEFECTVEMNYETKRKKFTDVKSGQVIAEEPLTQTDMQLKMQFDTEKSEKNKTKEIANDLNSESNGDKIIVPELDVLKKKTLIEFRKCDLKLLLAITVSLNLEPATNEKRKIAKIIYDHLKTL